MACSHPLEPLYRTDRGIVYQCHRCGWTNLVFGPLILAQDLSGFFELKRLLENLEPTGPPERPAEARCYHVRTANRQIGFAFTQDEIDELRELVRGTAAMLNLSTLLRETLGSGADKPPPCA